MLDIALVVASRAWRCAVVHGDGVRGVCSSTTSLRHRGCVCLALSHSAGAVCGRGEPEVSYCSRVETASLVHRPLSSIYAQSNVSLSWDDGRQPIPTASYTPCGRAVERHVRCRRGHSTHSSQGSAD